jgi:hypothetical protein
VVWVEAFLLSSVVRSTGDRVPTSWRRLLEEVADSYAAWVARAGPVARLVERGRRGVLRRVSRLAAELGLPFPWSEDLLWRADLSEVRLVLRKPGCPACRHLAEATARAFFWFLMEGYGEGEWIDRLIRAGGFCPRHMWQLADSGLAYRITYIVQYLSQDLRRRLATLSAALARGDRAAARARAALVHTEPCPMCMSLLRDLDWQIAKIVRCLRDPEIAALYAASDGFCWPHFQRAVAHATGPVLRLLAETQQDRLAVAGASLAAASRSAQQATALLSGWRFQPAQEREHGEWVVLESA